MLTPHPPQTLSYSPCYHPRAHGPALDQALLDRCADRAALVRHYSLPRFESAADFLTHLAHALQLPPAEGSDVPDPALAALAFLEQWRLGRVPFCSRPPADAGAGAGGRDARAAAPRAVELALQVYSDQVRAAKRSRTGGRRTRGPRTGAAGQSAAALARRASGGAAPLPPPVVLPTAPSYIRRARRAPPSRAPRARPQVNGELAAAFALAGAKSMAAAEGVHLVLEPSASGLESELVSRLGDAPARNVAARGRARAGARGSGEAQAGDTNATSPE